MDMLYILAGISAAGVFLFRMELLIREASFEYLLRAATVLFIVGVALHFTDAGRYSASGALLCPLPSLLLFRLMRRWFVRRFEREPRDATFNWAHGLGPDRVFGFVYFMTNAALVTSAAIGLRELAEAGW